MFKLIASADLMPVELLAAPAREIDFERSDPLRDNHTLLLLISASMSQAQKPTVHRRKVAFVLSAIGFHWEETAAAFRTMTEAGIEIHFFTPSGQVPEADPRSVIPRKFLSFVGIGSPLDISPVTEFGKNLWESLRKARPVIELNPSQFSGLYLPGGHGCLFDLNQNPALLNRILEFYQSGKPLGAVCHATSTFAYVQNQGIPIVEGKSLTGFPDLLDDILVQFDGVEKKFLPIPFSNDGKLISSKAKNSFLQRLMAFLNPYFFVVDAPFYTGVGPKAASSVARKMLENLK